MTRTTSVVAATAALLLAASGAAQAQSAADFYKSKGLTIFVDRMCGKPS